MQISCRKEISVYLCEKYLNRFIGELHLDLSMMELRYLASKTIFNDSPLVKIITGFMLCFLLVVVLYLHGK